MISVKKLFLFFSLIIAVAAGVALMTGGDAVTAVNNRSTDFSGSREKKSRYNRQETAFNSFFDTNDTIPAPRSFGHSGKEPLNQKKSHASLFSGDISHVKELAGEIVPPYSNEIEKETVLQRLEETRQMVTGMIGNIETRIEKALSDNSRSKEEINEAKEALEEMKKGRDFLSGRIHMVEKDRFE